MEAHTDVSVLSLVLHNGVPGAPLQQLDLDHQLEHVDGPEQVIDTSAKSN
jgi:hypothetical protein